MLETESLRRFIVKPYASWAPGIVTTEWKKARSEGLMMVLRKWKEKLWDMSYIWNQEKWVIGWNVLVRTVSTKLLKKFVSWQVQVRPVIQQTSFEYTELGTVPSLGMQVKATADTGIAQCETEFPSKCFIYVKWFNPYYTPLRQMLFLMLFYWWNYSTRGK